MGLSNYLPNSRISQAGVCTSSTRPASPYEGQVIYETDTDRTLVWNGTAWVDVSTGKAGKPGLVFIKEQALSGTSTNVTSCFSSDFNSYRVIVSNFDKTTTTVRTVSCRLLANTTADTSSNYAYMYHFAYGSNVGGNTSAQGQTSWEVALMSVRAGQHLEIELNSPFLAQASSMSYKSVTYQNDVTSYIVRQGGGGHNVATSYDGFQLFTTTDSLSGTIRVYGYNQ